MPFAYTKCKQLWNESHREVEDIPIRNAQVSNCSGKDMLREEYVGVGHTDFTNGSHEIISDKRIVVLYVRQWH